MGLFKISQQTLIHVTVFIPCIHKTRFLRFILRCVPYFALAFDL